ncbi:MAG: HIT domain-containing protein [Rickettsiales bacterium]
MDKFTLDKRLEHDSIFIKKLKISNLYLMNDANYPWFILVPVKSNISEIFELELAEQNLLMSEITAIAKMIKLHFKADKINVAALGNMVKQLHIHIIARYYDDLAFPDTVWGKFPAKAYNAEEIAKLKEIFTAKFSAM